MTAKAFLVSWLGKGNIVWTPLEETAKGAFSLGMAADGPMRHAIDLASNHPTIAANIQKFLDPTMAGISAIQSTVDLAANLAICTVGLQLATLTQTYRILQSVREVDRKISVISGKFELHFLDRSVDFFLQSHQNNAGLIAPVAAALEEDCYNALQAIVNNEDLRVPAYLSFKLTTQAQAIESWNQLLYSVIHNGSLPRVSTERLEKWVKETDPTTKSLPHGGYASQADILKIWEETIHLTKKDSNWLKEMFKSDDRPLLAKAIAKEHFHRAYPVILLAREIQNALSFAEALEEKIKINKDQPLLIKSAS